MIKRVKLGDVIELQRGYDLTHTNMDNGIYPVEGSTGTIGYHSEYKTEDTLVMGRSGTVGYPRIVRGKFWPHNTSLFATDIKGNTLEYLYYNLLNLGIYKLKTGSNIPTLNRNDLYPLLIPFETDIIIQEKIADILQSIDDKITTNNAINAELEALAKTIYDYWFLQFEFPNDEGKPYKSSGGKMVWCEELKREIPEGWGVAQLDSCISTIIDHRGLTPKKLGGDWVDEGIIALSAKIVKSGKLVNLSQAHQISLEMYEKWMPNKLQEGDILMTSEAPLGEFYFILIETDYCLSQRLFGIRADTRRVTSLYLYFELSSGNGYSQIMGRQSGSTVFGIRQDELRRIQILVPEINVQKKFSEYLMPLFIKQRINEIENRELAALRDWLLPMLMNGQVTVE